MEFFSVVCLSAAMELTLRAAMARRLSVYFIVEGDTEQMGKRFPLLRYWADDDTRTAGKDWALRAEVLESGGDAASTPPGDRCCTMQSPAWHEAMGG